MKWPPQADAEIKKAPFFVRKKARQRLEAQVSADGREVVTVEDVRAAKKRFLNRMDKEVKGFQVEACFGSEGCPNRIIEDDRLIRSIEKVFSEANLRGFLE
ncbi:MAG: PCP reductase family protein [Candidatus Desulfacyla sp.]